MLMVQRELSSKRTQMKVIKTNEIEILRSEWCNTPALQDLDIETAETSSFAFLSLFIFRFVELCEFFSAPFPFSISCMATLKTLARAMLLREACSFTPLGPLGPNKVLSGVWRLIYFWSPPAFCINRLKCFPDNFVRICTHTEVSTSPLYVWLIDWLYQRR